MRGFEIADEPGGLELEIMNWLESQGAVVPELVARRSDIAAGMSYVLPELLNEYELPEDPGDCLMLTALGLRWHEAQTEAELGFVHDVAAALQDNTAEGVDASTALVVYDLFTDAPLSAALKQAVDEGMLAASKERLQITPDTEDAYDIRVLQLTLADEAKPFERLQPPAGSAPVALSDILDWQEGLEERRHTFVAAMGNVALLEAARAWVEPINGVETICLSEPTAKILLGYAPVDKSAVRAAQALLEHEYAHTQGGSRSYDGRLGKNVEELRAEHFAKHNGGYADVKLFFESYSLITGHWLDKQFDSSPKGGTAFEVSAAIARHVGLGLMLEIVLCDPEHYAKYDTSPAVQAVRTRLGGPAGVLRRIFEMHGRSEQTATLPEDQRRAAIKRQLTEKAGILFDDYQQRIIAAGRAVNVGPANTAMLDMMAEDFVYSITGEAD